MELQEKKEKLAKALEAERNRLPEYNSFGEKNNLSGYEDAIIYLRTGVLSKNYENNDILLACVEDLGMMFSDYSI